MSRFSFTIIFFLCKQETKVGRAHRVPRLFSFFPFFLFFFIVYKTTLVIVTIFLFYCNDVIRERFIAYTFIISLLFVTSNFVFSCYRYLSEFVLRCEFIKVIKLIRRQLNDGASIRIAVFIFRAGFV